MRPSELRDAIDRVLRSDGKPFIDLVQLAGLPRTAFRYRSLGSIDLSGQDLSGFDFTGADLSGCNLTGATLTGAILTNAKLPVAHTTRAASSPRISLATASEAFVGAASDLRHDRMSSDQLEVLILTAPNFRTGLCAAYLMYSEGMGVSVELARTLLYRVPAGLIVQAALKLPPARRGKIPDREIDEWDVESLYQVLTYAIRAREGYDTKAAQKVLRRELITQSDIYGLALILDRDLRDQRRSPRRWIANTMAATADWLLEKSGGAKGQSPFFLAKKSITDVQHAFSKVGRQALDRGEVLPYGPSGFLAEVSPPLM